MTAYRADIPSRFGLLAESRYSGAEMLEQAQPHMRAHESSHKTILYV